MANSTGTARAKELTFKRIGEEALWNIKYLAFTMVLIAIGSIPPAKQEAFVATLKGEQDAKAPELTIRANGRGYLVTDGKNEMVLTPVGNVPTNKTTDFVAALRENVKAAHASG